MRTSLILMVYICFYSCTSPQTEKKDVAPTAQTTKETIKYPKDVTIDFIMGRFDPSIDTTFTTISSQHSDRNGLLMKKEAYAAFEKMSDAAQKDGIQLVIRSAARNFDYQKTIWEKKWSGATILSNGKNAQTEYPDPAIRAKTILEYSSMPGTSRHHWGTDIDFNSFNNQWFEKGKGLELFSWLENNASSYGFCRPYTAKGKERPHGYNEEKWHWTYMPLSKIYTSYAEQYLKDSMISGFQGSEVAEQLNVVSHYVLGINNNCKN